MLNFDYIETIKSKVDGPGKRDFILLNNCNLKCKYCLNKTYLQNAKHNIISSQELISIIKKDYGMFRKYKSGVSFGGGESLLQYEALIDFDKLFPKEFNILIETSINICSENFKYFLDNINLDRFLFYIDIKDINNNIYEKYTGLSNKNILSNLQILKNYNLQNKCQIIVPIIKGYNTLEDRIKTIEYLKSLGFENIKLVKYLLK